MECRVVICTTTRINSGAFNCQWHVGKVINLLLERDDLLEGSAGMLQN